MIARYFYCELINCVGRHKLRITIHKVSVQARIVHCPRQFIGVCVCVRVTARVIECEEIITFSRISHPSRNSASQFQNSVI
jgi:hypothetical protein